MHHGNIEARNLISIRPPDPANFGPASLWDDTPTKTERRNLQRYRTVQRAFDTRHQPCCGVLLALAILWCLMMVEGAADQQLPGACLADMIIRCSEQMRQKFWQGSGCDKQTGSRCHLKRNAHTLKQRRRSIATCQNDLVGSARTVIRHHPIDPIPVNHQTVNMPLFRLYGGSGKERLDGIIRLNSHFRWYIGSKRGYIPQAGQLCRNGVCRQQFDRIAPIFVAGGEGTQRLGVHVPGKPTNRCGDEIRNRLHPALPELHAGMAQIEIVPVIVGIGVDPCPAVGSGSSTAVDRQAG